MADPFNGYDTGTILGLATAAPQGLSYAEQPKLSDAQEADFQKWIKALPWFDQFVQQYGEEPDLSAQSDYNYRAAWQAGITPGEDGHWPSALPSGELLKSAQHPTLWKELEMRRTGENPDQANLLRQRFLQRLYQTGALPK